MDFLTRSWARRLFVAAGLLAAAALPVPEGAVASDYQVIISEVHYHPLGGVTSQNLEYLELRNLSGAAVDLGGWSFSEGLDLVIPAGMVLGAKGYLVVSPDPQAAAAHYRLPAGSILGPYQGRLDNDGEVVALRNARGEEVNRIHFEDGEPWPSLADGLGPSLEFSGDDTRNDLHFRWGASEVLGGTPGRPNTRRAAPPPEPPGGGTVLVAATDDWRTFKGFVEPSSPATAWTQSGFDDSAWTALPGGFGYGTNHGFGFRSDLDDMRFQYTTFYIRRTFTLEAAALGDIAAGKARLALDVDYDDGFVAYLNGVEVARENVGTAGLPPPFDGVADESQSGSARASLAQLKDLLTAGGNVLALQGLNNVSFSGDFYLGAELRLETEPVRPDDTESGPLVSGLLNEFRPRAGAASPGFIELFNPRSSPLDAGGLLIISTTGLNARVPDGLVIPPLGRLSLDDGVLRSVVSADDQVVLALEPDGATIVDVLAVEPRGEGNSFGRFPDGSGRTFVMVTPTPGGPNAYAYSSPIVINEIHYHPPFAPPAGNCAARCSDRHQWIELLNWSAGSVDLGGWSLARAVSYDFAPGTVLAPGQTIVVAASAAAFRAAFGDLPSLVGDWSGRLGHGSDRINLRDPLGNRVDSVRYGDGGPLNDETPANGADDRTFRGSPWPTEADGSGRTLELLHPDLDNDLGLSWRASAASGGTPGAQNSVFTASPAPVIGGVEHLPAVPSSSDEVRVTCVISSLEPIASARVEWDAEPGPAGTADLRDDGLSGDGGPGDGVWGAVIPAQADGAIVSFQVSAVDGASRSVRVPIQPQVAPYGGFQGAFFLYEVDDAVEPATGNAVYRIVMRPRDLEELQSRDLDSDVILPATFISGGEVRHVVGVRYRGENSRREPNRSFRVKFHAEDPFEGIEHINLNAGNGGAGGDSGARELLAADLFRRAGSPYPQTWPVAVHFPGEVSLDFDTRYVRKERFDEQFLDRYFGGSSDGNLYRPRNPVPGGQSGDLSYLGESPNAYRELYPKRSNEEEDDWRDLIELCRAFSRAQTPDAEFPARLDALIDARQWARFFVVMGMLGNSDGGIWNNNGEDYFLYHVPAGSTRSDAGKWLILPWDLEEAFNDQNEPLFRPTVASIARFLSHPRFAALYYEELATITSGVFSRAEMRRQFDLLGSMFAIDDVFDVMDPLDAFVADRNGFVDSTMPAGLLSGTIGGAAQGEVVIEAGAAWRFFRGRSDPPGGSPAWTLRNYDDTGWEAGPSGFGYGDGDDSTVLNDMQGAYTTVFARRELQVDDPRAVTGMTLLVDYDDGFVAYLNGVEVARSANAPGGPGSPVSSGMTASDTHEAGTPEPFDAGAGIGALVSGRNVLAIVGLNQSPDSSDFSLLPVLLIETGSAEGSISAGCGGPLHATGSEIELSGVAGAAAGFPFPRSVTVNGALAASAPITGGGGPYGLLWSAAVPLAPGDNLVRVASHAAADGSGPALEAETVLVRRVAALTSLASGPLAGDAVWTAAGSPYHLTGVVEVPAGRRLTIQPGVTVLVGGGGGIVVRGSLSAEGTERAPVVFSAFHCFEPWRGIRFEGTGTGVGAPENLLRHALLQHAESLPGAPGFVTVEDSILRVEDSTLRDIASDAIDGTDCRLDIRRTTFERVFEGVHCNTSTVSIVDSTFTSLIGDNDAVDLDGSGPERSLIARSLIDGGTDDGFDLGSVSVDITENVFRGVGDKAVSIEGNGAQGACSITWNLFHDCGTAMALKNGLTLTDGHHNTVTRCQEGIDLFAKDRAPNGGHAELHSLILWNNEVDLRHDDRSSVVVTFSDVGGEDVWPGTGNILAAPRFMDPEGDFALRAGSPCIRTGLDGTDMGAIPFAGSGPEFVRADTNADGFLNVTDAVFALNYLFLNGPGPRCLDRLDTNDDGFLNLTDGLFLLNYLFLGGTDIPAPHPAPGPDPTADAIACE